VRHLPTSFSSVGVSHLKWRYQGLLPGRRARRLGAGAPRMWRAQRFRPIPGFSAAAVSQFCPDIWTLICGDMADWIPPLSVGANRRAQDSGRSGGRAEWRVGASEAVSLALGQETQMELCVVTPREIITGRMVVVVILVVAVLVMTGSSASAAIAVVTAAGAAGLALAGRIPAAPGCGPE
jgi:hypothetical protein